MPRRSCYPAVFSVTFCDPDGVAVGQQINVQWALTSAAQGTIVSVPTGNNPYLHLPIQTRQHSIPEDSLMTLVTRLGLLLGLFRKQY